MKCPHCNKSNVEIHGLVNVRYWAYCEDCGKCSPSINQCDLNNISLPLIVVLSKRWHKQIKKENNEAYIKSYD